MSRSDRIGAAPVRRAWLPVLVRSCHPLPALAVTVFITAMSAVAGRDGTGVVLVAAAVLSGQLSIGWSNDARDETRDRLAHRMDKPLVRGEVTGALLWRLSGVALATSAVLSYAAAGPIGGTAHLVAVISAWTYNLLLKATPLSALPYAVSFGLVPAFVTYGLTPPAAPAPWASMACALLGVGAHLANAIPDIDRDREVGAGGLAALLGAGKSTVASLGCLLAALAMVVANVAVSAPAAIAVLTLGAAGALAVGLRGRGQALFRYALMLAGAAVLLLLAAGGAIAA